MEADEAVEAGEDVNDPPPELPVRAEPVEHVGVDLLADRPLLVLKLGLPLLQK